jgi:hypothetical protein
MKSKADKFNWYLPLYAAAATLVVFLPFALWSADLGAVIYVVVVAPIVSLVLLAVVLAAKSNRRRTVLSMLAVYWIGSAALVDNYSAVRDATRWLLFSKAYKAKVLEQSATDGRGLNHVYWDGWGWAGANTDVYLVFDPNGWLVPTEDPSPSKLRGLPCIVPRVRRLENHWYAVMFYTDTDWDHCH